MLLRDGAPLFICLLWIVKRLEISQLVPILQNTGVFSKFGSLTCCSSTTEHILMVLLTFDGGIEFNWCIFDPFIWKLSILVSLISLSVQNAMLIVKHEWIILGRHLQAILDLVKFYWIVLR